MHLHHPHFVGHQVSAPLPITAVVEMVSAMLNNSSAAFEMGPMEAVLEKALVAWFAERVGWSAGQAGGFFTSGGSLGNLSALLAARNKAQEDFSGKSQPGDLGVLVSEEAHYSIARALHILDIPEANVFKVQAEPGTPDALPRVLDVALSAARAASVRVFAVVVNAGSTSTGTFDDIAGAARFCEREKLWLHVDAAHGGPVLLSPRLRHRLEGIARADSVVIDGHKMMLMPALITAVLFRDNRDSYRTGFPQDVHYLHNTFQDEWYSLTKRTLECTKKLMVLKLFIALQMYGEAFFASYVERCYDLSQYFYQHVQKSPMLEMLKAPEFNIVCFRVKNKPDGVQYAIRDALLSKGEFYIVSTRVNGEVYLRCTLINPYTSEATIDDLLGRIERLSEIVTGRERR
jgi:L-2,4-diaminobutyrate decarboxylase